MWHAILASVVIHFLAFLSLFLLSMPWLHLFKPRPRDIIRVRMVAPRIETRRSTPSKPKTPPKKKQETVKKQEPKKEKPKTIVKPKETPKPVKKVAQKKKTPRKTPKPTPKPEKRQRVTKTPRPRPTPAYKPPPRRSTPAPSRSALSLTGKAEEELPLPAYYLEQVRRRIEENFQLSREHKKVPLKCVAAFTVLRDGQITDIQIVTSTGLPPADDVARETLRRTERVGPLPDSYRESSIRMMATFDFDL